MKFACPSCSRQFTVKPEFIGKTLKCACSQLIQVDASSFQQEAPETKSTSPSAVHDKITYNCSCGRRYQLASSSIGKMIKCACGVTQKFQPTSAQTSAQLEATPFEAAASLPPVGLNSSSNSSNDWLADLPAPSASYSPAYAPAYSGGSTAKSKPSNTSYTPTSSGNEYMRNAELERSGSRRESSFELLNASVLGGIGAMGLAVLWFGVGLYCGYIFFYPPVMFVLGLIGLIKGLLGEGDD